LNGAVMKVKICGITNIEDALIAESCGANAIGFIFYKRSKRYIAPSTAAEIIAALSPFTVKVGVFVNEEQDAVNGIASKIKLNAVQLHGDEKPEYISGINYPVIKGFRVKEEFDFSSIQKFIGIPLLLDAYSPAEYGGTGLSFNWNVIPSELKNKIVLAGGISINNIDHIMNIVKPAAIDVSSSLETDILSVPVRKDSLKIKNFFNKINLNKR
jgi:phosphoribosylanthranilate isomerase